ncbi:uncharacterized protein A1O5_01517 [Cladophialophora psammophila CBS 110553]|uniref:Uncharacterized protein n=1 Tax=Cladophialophora psammophila CBS 110553 TaxID=1182543 RepID=W9XCZ9_9EURO|nr:uncharacterized protein A1O5_01517 [Cladophialophora psammophila CBS 110553]EXJ74821.1 hypothetical protein A1O5_01517 [Cladophialophora psammophila CBS 110553]
MGSRRFWVSAFLLGLLISSVGFLVAALSDGDNPALKNGIQFNVTNADSSPRKLSDRATNGIYICQYPHWGGTCFWTPVDPSSYNQCAIITSHGGWASLGPDEGVKVDLYRYVLNP